MRIKNEAKGSIFYGMHFYPGCAEYVEENKKPYRVFLNDATIRSMGPSFQGKPVFVLHVDGVNDDLNALRGEADGWVIESFYNAADGKHWVKFIVCSEKGERAIKQGMKLSNCYMPKGFSSGGEWNGISYDREITGGEYEHLAIVPNPRYQESVIMTPEKFKAYNSDKLLEIERLSNTKQGDAKMKLSWFKRQKVENSTDLDGMCVILPTSKKEVSIEKLINEADDKEMKKGEPKMANPDHFVEVDGKKMTVDSLMKKFNAMCEKKNDDDDDDMDSEDPAMNDDDDMETAKKKTPKTDDEKKSEKQTLKLEEEEEKEVKDSKKNEDEDDDEDDEDEKEKMMAKKNKKKNAREKADRLRNANSDSQIPQAVVMLSDDKVARGKQLFGS